MNYEDLKKGISSYLTSAAEDFFTVGYLLKKINKDGLFAQDGYKDIWDFAKAEYGLSKSSTSRFMAINTRFSLDGGEHMDQRYIGMGSSKLQEMLSLPDSELEKVTKETTVREIRAMKKAAEEPLSYFGFRKTERPADSLITTPGCRNEECGYDCNACCHDCRIRQEPMRCYTAALGNPFPCSLMNNKEWKKSIQFSMFKDDCQMLHHELAEKRAGDGEPEPCCILCEHKNCFDRCDVAKQRDRADRKREQDELRKELKEKERKAEEKRLPPSLADIEMLYDRYFNYTDDITADGLKQKFARSYRGGGSLEYEGSSRGVRINNKKELTWVQLRNRFREIQKERSQAAQKAIKLSQDDEPDIIDAEFKAAIDDAKTDEPEETAGSSSGKQTEEPGAETEISETAQQPPMDTLSAKDTAPKDTAAGSYRFEEIENVFHEYSQKLHAYIEAEAPEYTIKKQRILVDALSLLLKETGQKEGELYD